MGVRVAKRFGRRVIPDVKSEEGGVNFEQLLTRRLPDKAPLERLEVTNVITTASLGVKRLRLRDLALATSNCEYSPRRGLLMRTRDPRTTATIQRDGSMLVMGASTFQESRRAARHFAYTVQQAGHPGVEFSRLRVASISAYVDLRCVVDLQKLAELLNDAMDDGGEEQQCVYDFDSPHASMRLLWRPRAIGEQLAVLIYHNGKLIFTGARKVVEHERAFDFVYPHICAAQIVKAVPGKMIEALCPFAGGSKTIRYSAETKIEKREELPDYKP